MHKNFEEKLQQINKIEGYLIGQEGKLLFKLARNCPKGLTIVEIGSWKGKSTAYLALGSLMGNKTTVYAIDPHTGSTEHRQKFGTVWTYDVFIDNIRKAQLSSIVKPLVLSSDAALSIVHENIGVLFIDGNHSYSQVKRDCINWSKKLADGGIIAFHDTTGDHPGVKKVVERYIYKSSQYKDIHLYESITYAVKSSHISLYDRARNRYLLLLKYIFEYARSLHPPQNIEQLGKRILNHIQ